jgi:isocitrate dehydrogenase kinase/phosphatase
VSDAIITTQQENLNPRHPPEQQMEIAIKLQIDEVNGLLNILGQLPTSTNIWPLAAKIRQQAEEQLPKDEGSTNVNEAGGTD